MAEKEYIDREKAIEIASGYCHPANIAAELAKLPTADVRPVVFCGKCVYFRLNSCMRWADGTFMERTDFCSRGAKREES